MHLLKTLTVLLVMLFAAACSTTRDEISLLKVSGECRKAEQLIKDEYSGQEELYDLALLYSECDGEKSKGLKILKTLAAGEYMPAMARLIELNAASPQMIKRYNILKQAAYERRQARKQRLYNYGRTTTTVSSRSNRPMEINNRCIQDGGTQMCYDRQSQRYGNY